MKNLKQISAIVDDLLQFGALLKATHRPGQHHEGYVELEMSNEFLTRCRAFAGRVFGENSEYYKAMTSTDVSSNYYPSVQKLYGQLRAIKSDLDAGALFEMQALVEAEVFDDLLDQAEHLASHGYAPSAAVIAGCVLEEALRRMCARNGVGLPPAPKLDWMNAELAKAAVYNKLQQKNITALADIRNSAAHGKYSEFTPSDVDNMIRDVRDFLVKHHQ